GADRMVEPERRADRDHPLTRLQVIRIADLHGGETGRIDLQQRDVVDLVFADDLGGESTMVGQVHLHGIRIGDHVPIGEDVTVGGNDEAGAQRLATAVGLLELRPERHAEEVAEDFRDLRFLCWLLTGLIAAHLAGVIVMCNYVHHRRPVFLHDAGEVRQRKNTAARKWRSFASPVSTWFSPHSIKIKTQKIPLLRAKVTTRGVSHRQTMRKGSVDSPSRSAAPSATRSVSVGRQTCWRTAAPAAARSRMAR